MSIIVAAKQIVMLSSSKLLKYSPKTLGLILCLSILSVFIINGLHGATTNAASASEWNAGNIIDDGIFYNNGDMSANDIQHFLNGITPTCDTQGQQPHSSGGTRAQYGSSHGAAPPYICVKDYYENPSNHANNLNGTIPPGSTSAAGIIKHAADTYGISAKVLIVLLQKEQALITDDWPWPIQYRSATGYGCPDTAPCDAEYYGFYNQVMNAARQFRLYANSPASYRYKPYQSNYIQYNPNASCGGSDVFIQNKATAGLYNYTPYQPNPSALGNLYGSGDACGAYGNRNFWRLFTDWFGSTNSNCVYTASVNNGLFRLFNPTTGNHLLTSSVAEACSAVRGGFFNDGQVLTSDASQAIPVYRLERHGRYLYTTSANERDGAVWNYGYRYEGIGFYATDPNSSEARPLYRLSSPNGYYLYTLSAAERDYFIQHNGYQYNGISFYVKENPGIAISPAYRLRNPNGTFLFTLSSRERDVATGSYGFIDEGVGFNAITQLNSITVPVYRMGGPRGYILTTNLQERINAFKAGFREEGIGMYTYGAQDESLTKIHRLRHPIGSYLYTTSEAERQNAAQYHWFINEGIGFRTP